jgi:hypothetical protein
LTVGGEGREVFEVEPPAFCLPRQSIESWEAQSDLLLVFGWKPEDPCAEAETL